MILAHYLVLDVSFLTFLVAFPILL
jgi:hypothetical protein